MSAKGRFSVNKTFSLFADSDVLATSDSRAELRGFLRSSELKAWAKSAGYASLFITIDGYRCFDLVELS